MRHEDVDLLGRIGKVNGAAGQMVLQVLSGVADDDALSGDFETIGHLFRGLGEAFIARSIELAPPNSPHIEQEAGESSDAP
jgi:hypothetical protein